MKRKEFRRVIAACIAGAVVFGMIQTPVKAAGNVEAGVTARSEERRVGKECRL